MSLSLSLSHERPLECTACFSVTACNDPAALPRVLEVFAKLGRAPHQCHATVNGFDPDDMHIDLQYHDMTDAEAMAAARSLGGCFLVKSVLTSQKHARMIA